MATSVSPLRPPGFDRLGPLPASPGTRAGELVFASGQVGADDSGAVASPGDPAAQASRAFEQLEAILAEAGGGIDDVVDLMSFHRDLRELDAVFEAGRRYLTPPYPAWTPVGMTGCWAEGAEVIIRAIAHLGPGERRGATPEATGWPDVPASAACRKGDLVFVSGQTAVEARDAGGQARGAYDRVRAALEAVGAGMGDVLDICSFHLDPRAMIPAERVHLETWESTPLENAPAWTAIGVPALWRAGAVAQYRVIADVSSGPRIAKTPASIHWKNTPNSGGSRKAGGTLIGIAGEVASDAEGNVTTPGDTLAQARYAFNRIREVVEMHGSSMANVVEVTSFHKDHRAWEIVMEAGREYFEPDAGPAWTPVGAVGLWNPGYLHEIYALAVV
jgi:enamine deaminase RidA (YjgF/YER057c/UK114 family)